MANIEEKIKLFENEYSHVRSCPKCSVGKLEWRPYGCDPAGTYYADKCNNCPYYENMED